MEKKCILDYKEEYVQPPGDGHETQTLIPSPLLLLAYMRQLYRGSEKRAKKGTLPEKSERFRTMRALRL
jgi:hypothetical protein